MQLDFHKSNNENTGFTIHKNWFILVLDLHKLKWTVRAACKSRDLCGIWDVTQNTLFLWWESQVSLFPAPNRHIRVFSRNYNAVFKYCFLVFRFDHFLLGSASSPLGSFALSVKCLESPSVSLSICPSVSSSLPPSLPLPAHSSL